MSVLSSRSERSEATGDGAPAPAPPALRFAGPLSGLAAPDRAALFDRSTSVDAAVRRTTASIIDRVRAEGDSALLALARELDGVELDSLEVPIGECRAALDALDPGLRRAMERAARNIATVHAASLPRSVRTSPEPGIVIERRPDPLARVGVYAPGGRATYPSSVLMGAIPARVAGVNEVILCTPPSGDGRPANALLAAAALAGVDRVFAIGGAGAIAALAFGTASVPRVDRIVGPGNAYVAEAKLQVAGAVAIDSPAGPSELLVIASGATDPEVVARELVAQAEHDPRACAVVVVVVDEDGEAAVVRRLISALSAAVGGAGRRAIVEDALAGQGGVLVARTLEEAVAFANAYAPEHLVVALDETTANDVAAGIRGAGTVFIGESSSNAFGDYCTGANHVLPTGGLARAYSGLSTLDFVRWTSLQRIDAGAAARLADDVARFAAAEMLPGHAAAASAWAGAPARADDQSRSACDEEVLNIARPEVVRLPRYVAAPPARDGEIDLSDNVNRWGMPPAARAALYALGDGASRYPAAYSDPLASRLREHVGVDNAAIVTGCGSDDVIDATMRAFARPGARIAFSEPTFSMIPTFARLNGLTPIAVPLLDADRGYDVDADALLATGAEIIYLCAPNNPTGTTISRGSIERVVSGAPGMVVLDEAYAEFAGCTHVDLVRDHSRFIVMRTMSKAFGLAGLRMGYGVASPQVAAVIERARGPYKVSAAAERCALAVLAASPNALGWVTEHARLAVTHRDRLASELAALGLNALPSAANFLFIPHARAERIARRLRDGGVIVRALAGLPTSLHALAAANGCALRIGVGPWTEMTSLLDALRTLPELG